MCSLTDDTPCMPRWPRKRRGTPPAIVIRSIEALTTPTPPMTPERRAEQVGKLRAAGMRTPEATTTQETTR